MAVDPWLVDSLARLDLPNPPQAKAGWIIDRRRLTQTLDYLAITKPLVVFLREYKVHKHTGQLTWGRHRAFDDHHEITVHTRLNDDHQANLTLYHELVHAIQAEDWSARTGNPMGGFYQQYKLARGRHGQAYWGNRYEREARAWSERLTGERVNEPIVYYPTDD